MIRAAIVRTVSRQGFSTIATGGISKTIILPAISRPTFHALPQQSSVNNAFTAIRNYSAPASLAKEEVEGRILDLLKGFDKVTDESKLNSNAHFVNDLGLDSLDTVEVVMAIEEEFSIEIPDKEADAIHSVNQAVNYILSQPDAR